MKIRKWIKPVFIVLGIVIPIISVVIYTITDMPSLFNSWTDPNVKPDWRYIWLIIFRLTLYILPPLVGMTGFYIENKFGIKKHRFLYYFMRALNMHFLVLLSIKLFADSILELDKIWDITLFNSIKDVQTLIGYVITLLIGRNMKVEPGIDEPTQLKEKIKKNL